MQNINDQQLPILQSSQIIDKMTTNRDKFDFEIGFLVKSPCKSCEKKDQFPKCFDTCSILDNIRGILASGISCTYSTAD
jgi:hypothetical protein